MVVEGEGADTQLGRHLPDEVRSAMEHHTAVVVGGGQSGLATAYYLRRYEVGFLILTIKRNPVEPRGTRWSVVARVAFTDAFFRRGVFQSARLADAAVPGVSAGKPCDRLSDKLRTTVRPPG